MVDLGVVDGRLGVVETVVVVDLAVVDGRLGVVETVVVVDLVVVDGRLGVVETVVVVDLAVVDRCLGVVETVVVVYFAVARQLTELHHTNHTVFTRAGTDHRTAGVTYSHQYSHRAFSALTLLTGLQEEHPASRN